MTRQGRKPLGPALVQHLPGSLRAKERLEVILETVAGNLTVGEACGRLGIHEAMFHRLRAGVLQAGLAHLEPRPLGRPSHPTSPDQEQVADMERRLDDLQAELQLAGVREEIAHVLPHVVTHDAARKKTTPVRSRRRRRRREPPATECFTVTNTINAEAAMNTTQMIDHLDAIARASRRAASQEHQRERRLREAEVRQQAAELTRELRDRGRPCAQLAQKLGVAPRTLAEWRRRHEKLLRRLAGPACHGIVLAPATRRARRSRSHGTSSRSSLAPESVPGPRAA